MVTHTQKKVTHFTTSGLQRTGERWLLKEKQEEEAELLLQKQVVTTGH